MKLANPDDKRTFRQYKMSIVHHSTMTAPTMELRYRARKRKREGPPPIKKPRIVRQTVNPFRTSIGSGHSAEHKLKAAALCSTHGICRMVPFRSMKRYKDIPSTQLYCKLCLHRGFRSRTTWGCLSCGCELHIRPCLTGSNKATISCADAAHQQEKINIDNLTVTK